MKPLDPSLNKPLASVLWCYCNERLVHCEKIKLFASKLVPPTPTPLHPAPLYFSLHCKLCNSNNQWKRSCVMQCMSLCVFFSMSFSSIDWMISLLVRLILFQHVCFSIMIYHDQISFSVADPGFFLKFQWRLHFNFHVIPTILIPYLMLSFLALLL